MCGSAVIVVLGSLTLRAEDLHMQQAMGLHIKEIQLFLKGELNWYRVRFDFSQTIYTANSHVISLYFAFSKC